MAIRRTLRGTSDHKATTAHDMASRDWYSNNCPCGNYSHIGNTSQWAMALWRHLAGSPFSSSTIFSYHSFTEFFPSRRAHCSLAAWPPIYHQTDWEHIRTKRWHCCLNCLFPFVCSCLYVRAPLIGTGTLISLQNCPCHLSALLLSHSLYDSAGARLWTGGNQMGTSSSSHLSTVRRTLYLQETREVVE